MVNGLTNEAQQLVKEQVAKELKPAKVLTFSTLGVLILGNAGAIVGLKGCIQDAAVVAAVKEVRSQTPIVNENIVDISREVRKLQGRSTLVDNTLTQNEKQVRDFQKNLRQRQLDLDDTGRQLTDARKRLSNTVDVINAFLKKATQLDQEDYTKELELLGGLLNELSSKDNLKLLTVMDTRINLLTLPIGSIVAWHKDLYPEASLPPGWVECNGPMKQDPESAVDMTRIPNLNGEARFLRGGMSSGNDQDHQVARHSHPHTHNTVWQMGVPGDDRITGPQTINAKGGRGADSKYDLVGVPEDPNTGRTNSSSSLFGGDETRPKNMSVVWIIRVN